jgi:hypothetical protein
MRFQKLQDEAKKFRDYVIQQSRSNLSKLKKNSSKALYNSLRGDVVQEGDNIDVVFSMLDYGLFQDKGVDGKKVKHGSEFSFKSKIPPPSALDKWIVQRGISPRDKKGRFMTRKQTQFIIARGIFNNGIKRSLFFTKPFEAAYKRAGKDFQQALGNDVAIYMDEIVSKSNRKNKKK